MARGRALFARGAAARDPDAATPLLRRCGAGGVRSGHPGRARDAAHERGGCSGAPGPVGAVALALGLGGVGQPDVQLEVARNLVSDPAGTAGAPRAHRAVRQLRRARPRDPDSVRLVERRTRARRERSGRREPRGAGRHRGGCGADGRHDLPGGRPCGCRRGGAAARQTGSAIRAERLPRLDLEADYGVNGLTMPSAISTRQVALQVTVPILDGFRREARIAEQNAAVSESRVRERDLRQQIAAEVDAALLDSRSAEAQQVVAAERLRLAADELAPARGRFKAGVAGNIEVIDAQSNLIRARDTDIDARFAAASARVALARAVGVASTLH